MFVILLANFGPILVNKLLTSLATLDKLALKKSSNNEVYEHVPKELAAEMETEDQASTQEIRKNRVHHTCHHTWFVSDSTWNKFFNRCAKEI